MLDGWDQAAPDGELPAPLTDAELRKLVRRPSFFRAMEAAYADDYSPSFPNPLELIGVCILMPVVGVVRVGMWGWRKVRTLVGGAR